MAGSEVFLHCDKGCNIVVSPELQLQLHNELEEDCAVFEAGEGIERTRVPVVISPFIRWSALSAIDLDIHEALDSLLGGFLLNFILPPLASSPYFLDISLSSPAPVVLSPPCKNDSIRESLCEGNIVVVV